MYTSRPLKTGKRLTDVLGLPKWKRQESRLETLGAIHSTKLSGNFGPKLNGSVRSNRKSFEKTGPPFEVALFSRSDRLEFWLNGSRPLSKQDLTAGLSRPSVFLPASSKGNTVNTKNCKQLIHHQTPRCSVISTHRCFRTHTLHPSLY